MRTHQNPLEIDEAFAPRAPQRAAHPVQSIMDQSSKARRVFFGGSSGNPLSLPLLSTSSLSAVKKPSSSFPPCRTISSMMALNPFCCSSIHRTTSLLCRCSAEISSKRSRAFSSALKACGADSIRETISAFIERPLALAAAAISSRMPAGSLSMNLSCSLTGSLEIVLFAISCTYRRANRKFIVSQ